MQWNLDCRALARLLELLSRNFGAELLTRLAISSRTAATWSGLYFPRLGSRCRPHAFLNRMGRKLRRACCGLYRALQVNLRQVLLPFGLSQARVFSTTGRVYASLTATYAPAIFGCLCWLGRRRAGIQSLPSVCRRAMETSECHFPPLALSFLFLRSFNYSSTHPFSPHPHLPRSHLPVSELHKCKLARQRSSMVMARWCYCTSHEIAHAHPAESLADCGLSWGSFVQILG